MLSTLQRRNLTSAAHVAVGVLVSLVMVVAVMHAEAEAGDPSNDAQGVPVQSSSGQAAATSAQTAQPIKAASDRPNIVMLMTDDQSVTDQVVLKKLQKRLGERGTTFTRAFSPYPLCCPARATLLTGQYAHNHDVLGNTQPYGGFANLDDSSTLPVWLQAAGYRTAMLGKYLNGYPTAPTRSTSRRAGTTGGCRSTTIYNYRHWTINRERRAVERHRGIPDRLRRRRGRRPGQHASPGPTRRSSCGSASSRRTAAAPTSATTRAPSAAGSARRRRQAATATRYAHARLPAKAQHQRARRQRQAALHPRPRHPVAPATHRAAPAAARVAALGRRRRGPHHRGRQAAGRASRTPSSSSRPTTAPWWASTAGRQDRSPTRSRRGCR